MRRDPTDHTQSHGFGRVEAPCREEQVARHRDADVRGKHGCIGGVGNAAQQLRDAERGAVTRHRDVGHHRDQEAARLTDPVDRGDHRRPTVANGQEREDVGTGGVGPRLAGLRPSAQIAAGSEHVVHPGDDERREVGIGVDEIHRSLDAVVHPRCERVACRGSVDDAPGDRTLTLQPQRRRAHVVLHGYDASSMKSSSTGAACTQGSKRLPVPASVASTARSHASSGHGGSISRDPSISVCTSNDVRFGWS